MLKKRQVVLNTPELRGPLGELDTPQDSPVFLRSNQYFQVGCDLRELGVLEKALGCIIDLSQATLLYVAEVSITYTETEHADKLLQWASAASDGRSQVQITFFR